MNQLKRFPIKYIRDFIKKDYKLRDEINIGYEVEDDDLPEEIEESSYVDELLTDGFHAVYDPLDELFGEPIAGYSL